jgi:xanthine dehydrogenase large subunit
LLTDAPSTYKIPTVMEVPEAFHVHLHQRTKAPRAQVIGGSKAVGEPPLMLALAVREALRDAVAAFGPSGVVELASPATPEAIYRAIRQVQGRPLS